MKINKSCLNLLNEAVKSSNKTSSLRNLHKPSPVVTNMIASNTSFVRNASNNSYLDAAKAEKEYSAARMSEKKLSNKLELLRAELAELDSKDERVLNHDEVSELENKRASVAAKLITVQAQLESASVAEEATFREMSSKMREFILREDARDSRFMGQKFMWAMLGLAAGTGLSYYLTSKNFEDAISEVKEAINDASFKTIGVDKVSTSMKRENEQLSAAIQELNENVVRNTASQNPSIPKLTNHIKDLTEVITSMQDKYDEGHDNLKSSIEELRNCNQEIVVTPTNMQIEGMLSDATERIVGRIDQMHTHMVSYQQTAPPCDENPQETDELPPHLTPRTMQIVHETLNPGQEFQNREKTPNEFQSRENTPIRKQNDAIKTVMGMGIVTALLFYIIQG